ncbi:metal-dependent hydrolase [Mycobacteroides chelonae]|uniref:Metal-dependent hydrolase n=1 Tax=Mycobacteroides chelonae TaxID=1774 RepID=A0A1S1MDE6_MYCCH|nr:metal-dependent hydrolase [Mycobacteroides chelonae]OHU80887.1 metal-dependent hydrolase [Mycobacteroides chelonae]QQG88981.1 metal-dependent hydrolase [Mycobacteroides chelonae]QQG93795.1 metal-dependent hydrolase [Mycobacteroides chelonae]
MVLAEQAYPRVRRMDFGFDASPPESKYFADNSIMFSHTIAFLSAIFPPGEDIFVRSVRRYMDKITDPELKKRVMGFIGQEKVHGNQHRELNEKLTAMGYPTAWFEYILESTERMEKFLDKQYPDPDRLPRYRHFFLGFTVAAEHFTATWAENILKSPELQAMAHDPGVKKLLNWHALEELEHKSVAFDVYRYLQVPESTRIRWMYFAGNFGIPIVVLFSWLSIAAADPEGRRQPFRVLKETVQMLRNPMWKGFHRDMRPFFKRDFHPDQIDTTNLLEHWQKELFGEQGQLVGNLRQPGR